MFTLYHPKGYWGITFTLNLILYLANECFDFPDTVFNCLFL